MRKYVTESYVLDPPKFNFADFEKFKNEIIYIKKNEHDFIPCLFIQDFNQCNKFLIIFHGNNEDIFQLEQTAGIFREVLKMNIIVVEYPGYSIYFSKKNPEIILEDTTIVYDFIKEKFNINDEDIFIYGRSIGSAPSIYLASKRQAKALFVVSGFLSLKDVGKGLYVGWALEDIFKNIEFITQIKMPTLFIHGKKDSLISWYQTEKLFEICPSTKKKTRYIENMDHNNYDLIQDILNNINVFLSNQIGDLKRINNHYNLYDSKFDDILKAPKFISYYIGTMNFSLNNFIKIDKYFDKINMVILLKDERKFALVYDKVINVCDTINFNKYFSIKTENKIIFVNQLKNRNLLYCTNDGRAYIIKIELTKYYNLNKFKFSESPTNYCKIIELENNDLIGLKNEFYPLIHISQDKNSSKNEYNKFETIENFKNYIFNDIIDIETNRVAIVSCINDLLVIFNYLTGKTNNNTIVFDKSYITTYSNYLYFFNHQYLIILKGNDITIYDVYMNKFYIKKFFLKSKFTLMNTVKINTSDLIITFCYFLNPFCLILGTSEGKLFLFNLEKNIRMNEEISISEPKTLNFKGSAIINIILENNILILHSKDRILNIYYKNDNLNKAGCLIS